MEDQPGPGFAGLLRQLRSEAKLTQEELAEAAGLSPRSVSDLERGIHRTARKDTAGLLAGALGLAGPAHALFVAAARAAGPRRRCSRPRMKPLQVPPRPRPPAPCRAKTALAVHAAHPLAPSFPDGQFFLPLHAHTPGQRPVDPADALASLLLTAGLAAAQIPPGLEARAARWRDVVAGKRILLLLDDAAGHEQVRPLLPGTAGSLVLVTSRRRLAALEDAAQISLDTLSPGEAAALLARLAARPGLRPRPGRGVPAAGADDLPAHRRPGRPAGPESSR